MIKKQRNYRAVFEIGDRDENNEFIPREELVITLPFTIQFETNTGINNIASNTGHFIFYNLSEDNKALLWLDIFNFARKYIYFRLYAGYGDNMPLIFAGFITQCMSYKNEGSTDFITEIVANNNGMAQDLSYLNVTFTKGTTLSDIIKIATSDNKFLREGYITPDISPLKRDRTFIGQPLDLLKREYGGYDIFITNNEINVLGDREVIPGEIMVLSDKSGLLGSPKRSNYWVEFTSIFEPQLKAGQAIALNSTTLPFLNRAYKIIQVQHKGIISTTVCGKLITTGQLFGFENDKDIKELKKEVQANYTPPPTKGLWDKPTKIGKITSPYGTRVAPIDGATTDHKGIDIGVGKGTPVYAVANGKVIPMRANPYNGNYVVIDHGKVNNKSVTSWYLHLNKFIVAAGQVVSKGQLIAYSGNTGLSEAPHLHFAIKENNAFVNPTIYIGNY